MRRDDDGTVQTPRRPARLLPYLLYVQGAGGGLSRLEAVVRDGDAVVYLDQRLLPHEVRYERARTTEDFETAIRSLAVRGAPCIGVFGAYAVAVLREAISDDRAFE